MPGWDTQYNMDGWEPDLKLAAQIGAGEADQACEGVQEMVMLHLWLRQSTILLLVNVGCTTWSILMLYNTMVPRGVTKGKI